MPKAEELVRQLLIELGHDPRSEELFETPRRLVGYLEEFSYGRPFKFTTFKNPGYSEMVVENSIPFSSLCAHHLAPFFGYAYVGYIPNLRIAGLSKLSRAVDHFSRRLQNQERLTNQIAEYLDQKLKPLGVAVVLRAEHTCMSVRGVCKPGVVTATLCMRGAFKTDPATRAEFMAQLPPTKA